MTRILCCLMLTWTLTGCGAPNTTHYNHRVDMEVGRLQEPAVPLAAYRQFELKELVINDLIREKADKATVAKEIERRLKNKIEPLLQEWNAKGEGDEKSGKLVITPKLHELQLVSSGARFWVGGWAGDSKIDMDLIVREAGSGKLIASPRIALTANAQVGAWSVGATDRNILNYLTDISYEYLKRNY